MSFLLRSALTLGSIVGARQAAKAFRNFDMDDALGYIGLERRGSPISTAALIALSAAVGAGAALMLAPSSGAELRSRLTDRLQDAKSRLQHLGGNEGRQFSDVAGT
ncbi:MAG TPA: YtxH domain-containing protein [Polyangiaceae bacterium]|nr:YtxH domain-containing protein [Polyangiaceae bacterium]